MGINKVVYGNNTLIDISEDTVTADDVVAGTTFHTADGLKEYGAISNFRGELIECDGYIDEESNTVGMQIKNDWGILDFLNAAVDLSTRFFCSLTDIIPKLGNAKPSDVKKGVVFSSNQGIKLVGTYEEVTPETKTFTETYVMAANEFKTINCGFKPKFVWFGKNATGSPLISCYYNENASTTQYMQATAGTMRWVNLGTGGTGNPSIDITDTGCVIKNSANTNANMMVVAIG